MHLSEETTSIVKDLFVILVLAVILILVTVASRYEATDRPVETPEQRPSAS